MSETKSDVLLEVKNLHKAFDKQVVSAMWDFLGVSQEDLYEDALS